MTVMKGTIVTLLSMLIVMGECSAETLKIATLSYPPFQYEEDGEAKGLAADIIREVFRRMDQPIEISFYSFLRAVENIKEGKSDVIFTFYYKPEREEYADYSTEPLVEQTISLFVHKDSPIVFDGDLSKLQPYRFGLVRFSYGQIFDDAVSNGVIKHIEYVAQMEQNMEKFIRHRFNILPSDRWVAYYYYAKIASVQGQQSIQMKELTPSIETFPALIGFSKVNNLTAIRDKVDATLREMKADGSYQRIRDSHIASWGIQLP